MVTRTSVSSRSNPAAELRQRAEPCAATDPSLIDPAPIRYRAVHSTKMPLRRSRQQGRLRALSVKRG